jgi:hypothetical protein
MTSQFCYCEDGDDPSIRSSGPKHPDDEPDNPNRAYFQDAICRCDMQETVVGSYDSAGDDQKAGYPRPKQQIEPPRITQAQDKNNRIANSVGDTGPKENIEAEKSDRDGELKREQSRLAGLVCASVHPGNIQQSRPSPGPDRRESPRLTNRAAIVKGSSASARGMKICPSVSAHALRPGPSLQRQGRSWAPIQVAALRLVWESASFGAGLAACVGGQPAPLPASPFGCAAQLFAPCRPPGETPSRLMIPSWPRDPSLLGMIVRVLFPELERAGPENFPAARTACAQPQQTQTTIACEMTIVRPRMEIVLLPQKNCPNAGETTPSLILRPGRPVISASCFSAACWQIRVCRNARLNDIVGYGGRSATVG